LVLLELPIVHCLASHGSTLRPRFLTQVNFTTTFHPSATMITTILVVVKQLNFAAPAHVLYCVGWLGVADVAVMRPIELASNRTVKATADLLLEATRPALEL